MREFLIEVADPTVGLKIAPLILLEQPQLTHPDKPFSQLCVWRSGDSVKLPVFKRLMLLVNLDCRMRGKPRHPGDAGSHAPMSFEEACADLKAAALLYTQDGRSAGDTAATSGRKRKAEPRVSLSGIQKYLSSKVDMPGGGKEKVSWPPAEYAKAVPEFYSLKRVDCVLSKAFTSGEVSVLS